MLDSFNLNLNLQTVSLSRHWWMCESLLPEWCNMCERHCWLQMRLSPWVRRLLLWWGWAAILLCFYIVVIVYLLNWLSRVVLCYKKLETLKWYYYSLLRRRTRIDGADSFLLPPPLIRNFRLLFLYFFLSFQCVKFHAFPLSDSPPDTASLC